MKNIVIGTIAISLSTLCLAEEPKILNEKFTMSGNVIDGGVTHHIQTWMADSNDASVNVSTHDASGAINQNIRLDGKHHFRIQNHTGHTERYHFIYSLDTTDGDNYRHEGDVDIKFGQAWDDNADAFVIVNKNHSGQWKITAQSRIIGETGATKNAHAKLKVG